MPRITAPVRDSAIEARRDEFLTVKEYAFMVKQNPESVRRRLRAGRQPGAVRVGGQWRIDVAIASPARSAEHTDEVKDQQETPGTAEAPAPETPAAETAPDAPKGD
jgi:hypothetical protein